MQHAVSQRGDENASTLRLMQPDSINLVCAGLIDRKMLSLENWV